jgi:hypothetical protein
MTSDDEPRQPITLQAGKPPEMRVSASPATLHVAPARAEGGDAKNA